LKPEEKNTLYQKYHKRANFMEGFSVFVNSEK